MDVFALAGVAEVSLLDAFAKHWVHVDHARAAADGEEGGGAVQDGGERKATDFDRAFRKSVRETCELRHGSWRGSRSDLDSRSAGSSLELGERFQRV